MIGVTRLARIKRSWTPSRALTVVGGQCKRPWWDRENAAGSGAYGSEPVTISSASGGAHGSAPAVTSMSDGR